MIKWNFLVYVHIFYVFSEFPVSFLYQKNSLKSVTMMVDLVISLWSYIKCPRRL